MVFAAAHVVKGWTTQLGLFGGAQWSTAANEGMFVSPIAQKLSSIFWELKFVLWVPHRETMVLDSESQLHWALIVWILS